MNVAICEAQNQTDAEKEEERQNTLRLILPFIQVVDKRGEKRIEVELEALVCVVLDVITLVAHFGNANCEVERLDEEYRRSNRDSHKPVRRRN